MAYYATPENDYWTVPRYGDPSNTLIDGLEGTDRLSFDRLASSRFTIEKDQSTGIISIDSVSGASSTYHLKLKNVELLSFSSGRETVNLTTLFADNIAPTLADSIPLNDANGVAVDSNLVLTFSEAISAGSGNITLKTSSGATVENFSVSSSNGIQISGDTLTINPSANLDNGTSYTLSFANGSITDTSGNALSSQTSYAFTTVAAPVEPTPVVVDTTPVTTTPVVNTPVDTGAGLASVEDAKTLARLYKAAFNREPDSGGLNFWIDQWENGVALDGIAQGFVNSPEFNSLYDTGSQEAYIISLYTNTLGRGPDAGGLAFWLDGYSAGLYDQTDLLIHFSESAENRQGTDPVFANMQESAGTWFW